MGPLPSPQPLASNVPPPPGLAPGTRLGRYEVVSELGTGGMATVYLGRALAAAGFQRLVAIKVLHPHLLRDEQFVQMFLDEGRLAARIHHPNVVATVDLEHTAQGLYIVSEYIEGDILLGLYKAARAQEKRIPFGVSLRVMLDALAGLHAAHELADDLGNPLKIIHRDVSPHNILVGSDGIARITDFGIAKAEERISTTRDGIVKGKLSYMAPEQPNDLPIDRRVDIFSAATVLWECLTGRRLFPGKTDGEVLQALLHKPITRLREVDPTLSPALDDVLARALSRDPDARFDTAADFADALEHAAASQGIANARAVAQYVKDVAGAKITAEHERRRLTTRDLPLFRGTPSQVRPIERGSVPPPGPTSDAPPPAPPPSAAASGSDAPPSPRSTPSHPSLPAVRLPPLPATHMAPPPPPPPADARISTPPLEPPPPPEPGEVPELPSETIPSLVPPPPAAMSVPLARSAVSDEAPTQLQSLGHTPAGGTRAPPPSPLHTPAAGRPAIPPFPRSTPSAPLPPLPPLGVRTSVVASVPPPPPADPPAVAAVPSFVTAAHEGHEDTVQGLAPPPAPAVSAPPPPPPPPSSGATPSAPADAPPDTVRDLSLAATTAMAAIAPMPPPAAEAPPPAPAAPLTPGATTVADDDDAAPTLLAIPAPPGMGRPSRKPAVPAPPIPGPAASLPAVAASAPPAVAVTSPRPVVQPRVATGAHTPAEGRRRGPLVVGVVALGVLLGYGIWSFTAPASAPVEPHAASPAVVYPAARPAEPPASPPPMADPAPAQPDPAPAQPVIAAPPPAPAQPPPAPVQPPPAPVQPVAAPAPPAPVARPAVAAPPPAPVARPAVAPAPTAPPPVARPPAAPAPAPEPSTGTVAPTPVLPAPAAESPALPTTI